MLSIQGIKLLLAGGLSGCGTLSPTHGHRILYDHAASLVPFCLLLRHIVFLSVSQAHLSAPGPLHMLSPLPGLCSLHSLPTLSSHPTFRHSSSFFRSLHQCCFLENFPDPPPKLSSGICFQSLDTCQDSLLPLSLGFQVERDGSECQVSWLDGSRVDALYVVC